MDRYLLVVLLKSSSGQDSHRDCRCASFPDRPVPNVSPQFLPTWQFMNIIIIIINIDIMENMDTLGHASFPFHSCFWSPALAFALFGSLLRSVAALGRLGLFGPG